MLFLETPLSGTRSIDKYIEPATHVTFPIAGLFMQQAGSAGFMLYMVVIYGGLAIYAVYRMTQSKVLPPSETGDLVPVAPMATAIAATAVAEEMAETAEHDRPAA